jgi:hypothetical protein
MTRIDYIPFAGWRNNVRIANEHAELIITLDVGPRVISYRRTDGENVFKVFDEQLGGTGEAKWMSRGGHRFWLAPEDEVLSYVPDNARVEHRVIGDNAVELINAPSEQLPVKKTLSVSLDPDLSRVTVVHRAENHGSADRTLATWGLSVMAAGGTEIIPLPRLGEHPRDLLPNRTMTLWPYTDMCDPRWNWGQRFTTLRQSRHLGPTKLGLAHRERWVGYCNGGALFVKTFGYVEGANYPDFGCNFETFTNEEMLEVESLGPLVSLAPGAATEHTEEWQLVQGATPPPEADAEISSWIAPLLRKASL